MGSQQNQENLQLFFPESFPAALLNNLGSVSSQRTLLPFFTLGLPMARRPWQVCCQHLRPPHWQLAPIGFLMSTHSSLPEAQVNPIQSAVPAAHNAFRAVREQALQTVVGTAATCKSVWKTQNTSLIPIETGSSLALLHKTFAT